MAGLQARVNRLMTALVTELWIAWHRLAVLGGRW